MGHTYDQAAMAAQGTVSDADLEHCAREPIERPGTIQPFGALLVADAESGLLVQGSSNAPAALGAPWSSLPTLELLGKAVWEVLGCTQADWQAWCQGTTASTRPAALSQKQHPLHARAEWLLHQPERQAGQAPVWVLEWVPVVLSAHEEPGDLDVFEAMAQSVALLQSSASTEAFERRSVEIIAELTGYDRVMLYRFAPDWSGQVVAEATGEQQPVRFLGLHFPASDIPSQARALYTRKGLRLIGDVEAAPVPLIGVAGHAPNTLDMGQCLLRSTSPMHLQYLRNMGVRATLTISLMHEGRLWGMLACHHHTPKVPPQQVRQSVLIACELMAVSLAGRLETLQQIERIERERSTEALFSEVNRSMLSDVSIEQVWSQCQEVLSPLVGASRLGLMVNSQWLGTPPLPDDLAADLLARAQACQDAETLVTDSVVADFGWDPAAAAAMNVAGACASVLPGVPDSLLVALRPEWPREVSWAGQPGRFDPVRTPDGRTLLGPRQSFDTWREVEKHRGRAWQPWDTLIIRRLASAMARAQFQREAQRMQAERQLLHSSMEHLRDMVVVTDANPRHSPGPRIVYVNPAALAHSGYTEAEVLGQTPRIFQGPLTDAATLRDIATAIHQWQPIRTTLINYTKAGQPYWVELDIAPIKTEGDWYTHWVSVQRDVTQERELSTRLQDTHDRLARVLKGANDAAWDMNLSDNSLYCSPRWFEMLGYPPGAFVPTPEMAMEMVQPEERGAFQALLARVLTDGPDQFDTEFGMRHQDGHYVSVHCRGWIERDASGQAIRVSGANSDITSRRLTEHALEQEKRRLQNIIKGTGAGTWQLNLQTNQSIFNDDWARMLGYTLEELKPRGNDTWVSLLHPDDKAAALAAADTHITGKTEFYTAEFRMNHRDGHWVWIQARGQVIERDALGHPVWMFGTHVDVTEARRAREELEAQHRFLYEITSQLPGVVFELERTPDGNFHYTYLSEASFTVLGVDAESVMRSANVLLDNIHPEDAPSRNEQLQRSAITLALYEYRYRYLKPMPDGSVAQRWMESHATPKRLPDGRVVWHGFIRDATDKLEMQQALETAQSDLAATLTALPDLLFEFDEDGRFVKVHAPNANMLLLPADDFPGRTVADIAPEPVARLFTQAMELAARDGSAHGVEYHLDIQGETRWFESSVARKIQPGDHAVHFVALIRDITERKSAERRIEELAFYDPLTGLSNRRFLLDRIDQALLHNHVSGDALAVIFIDLDHFKNLNDTLGHHIGDQLLQQVAMRLEAELQLGDTVARIGGDEFAVLLPQLGTDESAAALHVNAVAEKLLKALNLSYLLSGAGFHCTPSLGIAMAGPEIAGHSEILKRADIALYQAKNAGRNCARFFDEATQAMVAQRSSLEQDLRSAVQHDQLRLFFQPIVNAHGDPMGHEALVRWEHPERGMVPPIQFIPLAEQSHLILEIGQWVLDTACHTLALWATIPDRTEWTLSVNVSARQLETPDFVDTVLRTVRRHGAPAHRLKLELTESLLQDNVQDSITKMKALTAEGVKFSLDDFGTGYSSLSYLKRLPLNQLKIDRAFVRDLLTDPDDAAIARMIIQLAQTLRLTVVAEGVETEGQFGYLAGMGCDAFQGYLFGKPVPHDQISSRKR